MRFSLVALGLLYLCGWSSVVAGEMTVQEREFIRSIREAKEEVDKRQRECDDFRAKLEEARKPLSEASARVKKAGRAREILLADISALRREMKQRLERTRVAILRQQKALEFAERDLQRATTDKEREAERWNLKLVRRNLKQLERSLEDKKKEGRYEQRLETAREANEQAKEVYWKERKQERRLFTVFEYAEDSLHLREKLLGEALDKLTALRFEAPRVLAAVEPPFLRRVSVTSRDGSKLYYERYWQDLEEVLSRQLEVCQEMIREQRERLVDFKKARDDLLEMMSDADRRWHELNEIYITKVKREAWGRVGMEVLDSAASIFLSKSANWPVNVGLEVADRGYKFVRWSMGYDAPFFSFPKVSDRPIRSSPAGLAAESFGRTFAWKEQGYGGLKNALENAIKMIAVRDPQGLPLSKGYKNYSMWAVAEASLRAEIMGRPNSEELMQRAQGTLELMTKNRARAMKAMVQEFKKDFWKSQATSVGKTLAKEFGKAWMREERAKVFMKMYEIDVEWRILLQDMRCASRSYKRERLKLEALESIRNDLLEEFRKVDDKRLFRRATSKVLQDDGGGVRLVLEFTRPVKNLSVSLAGHAVTVTKKEKTAQGMISLDGLPGLAGLEVQARDEYSDKQLDSRPATGARFLVDTEEWKGYEPGADSYHWLQIEPSLEPSVVVLLDCSNSMGEPVDRLGPAKRAVVRLIDGGDAGEMAIWVFDGSGIRLVQGFTDDAKKLKAALDPLEPGGATPLADAILQAGRHLIQDGRHPNKILVVLSDGADTERGSPAEALRTIRRLARDVGETVSVEREVRR